MATEGEFPKADGDILYASEVNRFAKAGGLLQGGSFAQVTSGTTAGSVLGSIFVGAGSVANPCHIMITANLNRDTSANNFTIQISGTSQGNNRSVSAGSGMTQDIMSQVDMILGSPMATCPVIMDLWNKNGLENQNYDGVVNDRRWSSDTSITNFDSSSNFVIFFGIGNESHTLESSRSDITVESYSVQSFRGVI